MMVDRALTRLQTEYPDLDIEKVDVVTNPKRAWKDGVRMIPTLKSENNTLSGIILSADRVRDFIEDHLRDEKTT